MQHYQSAIARILLASVFLGAVLLRLTAIMSHPNGYIEYQQALGQLGLISLFAPLLILVQLVAGLGLLVGFKTKLFAYVLAGLAFFMGIVLGKVDFQSMFIYFGIAGGMLVLAANPITSLSVDNLKK